MKRNSIILLIPVVLLLGGYHAFTFYDNRFPLGRMWETPAIRPHEEKIPGMPSGTVPFDGGEAAYRISDGAEISSPFTVRDRVSIKAGERLYFTYCAQCHGKYHDGNGTVGQSFAPLPGDLRSVKVHSMHEGELFKEISYGVPGGRQPALATTLAVNDRWKIIAYVKSLGVRSISE